MGAGAVRGTQDHAQTQIEIKNDSNNQLAVMACEKCGATFGILKRKKICADCGNYHCSACVTKVASNKRQCQLCQMYASKQFDRHTLMDLRLKDLKVYLNKHVIQYQRCTEKNDLVELILTHAGNQSYLQEQEEHRRHLEMLKENRLQDQLENDSESSPSSNDSSSNRHDENDNTHSTVLSPEPESDQQTNPDPSQATHFSEDETNEERSERLRRRQEEERRNLEERMGNNWFMDSEEEPSPRAPRVIMNLNSIESIDKIDTLTPRQLKELLAANFVDYKGCVEKWELVDKAKRLWQSKKKKVPTATLR